MDVLSECGAGVGRGRFGRGRGGSVLFWGFDFHFGFSHGFLLLLWFGLLLLWRMISFCGGRHGVRLFGWLRRFPRSLINKRIFLGNVDRAVKNESILEI